jgi:phosphate transport system permease protein
MQTKRGRERAVQGLFFLCGLVTVLCVGCITLFLLGAGLPALRQIGLWDFFLGRTWAPTAPEPVYGIFPFWLTSVLGTVGALVLGVPLGFFTAVYIAKMAHPKAKGALTGAVSLLAGIPSVVYGLVGMLVLVPAIRRVFAVPDGAGLLAAMVVLGVMVLPSLVSVACTALEAVPESYEQASLALGATPVETYFRVSVPAARSGLAAAVVLGVGRAMGEAMAVMMVSGNAPNMPGLFQSVRFLTTAIASEMAYASGLQRQALYSIGLALFLFVLGLNAGLRRLWKGRGEETS